MLFELKENLDYAVAATTLFIHEVLLKSSLGAAQGNPGSMARNSRIKNFHWLTTINFLSIVNLKSTQFKHNYLRFLF